LVRSFISDLHWGQEGIVGYLQELEFQHPDPAVGVPAIASTCVERVPASPEHHSRCLVTCLGIRDEPDTRSRVLNGVETLCYTVGLTDVLQLLAPYSCQFEGDTRGPAGHVDRRAPLAIVRLDILCPPVVPTVVIDASICLESSTVCLVLHRDVLMGLPGESTAGDDTPGFPSPQAIAGGTMR
jgi:hypothetical protein